MRPIIWLASYPRSGNTYLRALLGNYFSGRDDPLSINELPAYSLGEHSWSTWRAVAGANAHELELDEIWAARPAYFDRVRAKPGEGPLLVKTHTMNGMYNGVRAFDFHPDDRVVHLVRHPGDVAISTADFNGISVDDAIDRLLQPGLLIDGRPRGTFEILGSWEQHTRNWVDESRIPILTVRYSDLVERPTEALGAIIAFMGSPMDPARISRAADFARFDVLRAQEDEAGFVENSPLAKSGRFFREGRASQWPKVLSPEQAERLIAPNRARIEQLGLT